MGRRQQSADQFSVTNFLLYYLKSERLDNWDPTIFLVALSVGLLSLVVVSVLTRPEPENRISSFFTRLQTPSDLSPDEVAVQGSFAPYLEERAKSLLNQSSDLSLWAAKHGRQSLLVNLLCLRRGARGIAFCQAYRDDLKGLLIGSALSAGLVIGLWLLLRI